MKVPFVLLAFGLATLSLPAQSRVKSAQSPLVPAKVNGTWTGGNNTIKVNILAEGQVQVEFEGATVFASAQERIENYLEYFVVDAGENAVTVTTGTGDVLTLTFSNGGLEVQQEGDGLGKGIRAEGTYVRESSARPCFSQVAQSQSGRTRRMKVMMAPTPPSSNSTPMVRNAPRLIVAPTDRYPATVSDTVISVRRTPTPIDMGDLPLEAQQRLMEAVYQTTDTTNAPKIQAPAHPSRP